MLPGLGGGWTLCSTEDLGTQAAEPLSGVFGRGGLVLTGGYVLRPYRRGGAVRHFNGGTYASPRRFRREFDVHAAIWASGFPTVEPIGYAYRRHLWGYEGVFVTKMLQGTPWPRAWGADSSAARAADLIISLSAWDLWAPDLNATNFLITPGGDMAALDWDRADWTMRPRLLGRHLERLERSMKKLDAPPALIDALRARATAVGE
jgi:hypothetical protein